MAVKRLFTTAWDDYELIDAGNGKKFERWGKVYTIRPEVQAYFKPSLPITKWKELAHFEFEQTSSKGGKWKILKTNQDQNWTIQFDQFTFNLELTKFKHVGLFPEQRTNWDFIQSNLPANGKFLNLFAYTGAASLVAKSTGSETIHVDSVKALITWAKSNQDASKLDGIKWVHEDALKFAEREVKRGNKYDGVIMDPPAWGLGAKGEKWKIEDKLESLFEMTSKLLNPKGFLILNTYTPTVEIKDIQFLVNRYFSSKNIQLEELWAKTTHGKELYFGIVLRVC
jgi:23S rRNA (cytosine1962-C5)-methyltransferase